MMKQNLSYKMILSRMNNYIATNLKNRSDTILRLWAGQCENILAQRFRRGQQMLSLYAKIWEDRALKELFHRLRRQVSESTHLVLYIFSTVMKTNVYLSQFVFMECTIMCSRVNV